MSNRSYAQIYYHFIWATNKNANLIEPQWENRLYEFITGKCRFHKCYPLAIGGTDNHLHLLLRAYPDLTPSELIGKIKGSSSHFVNEQKFLPYRFSWQDSYSVFSISLLDIDMLINYIKNQKHFHENNTLIEEHEESHCLRSQNIETTEEHHFMNISGSEEPQKTN